MRSGPGHGRRDATGGRQNGGAVTGGRNSGRDLGRLWRGQSRAPRGPVWQGPNKSPQDTGGDSDRRGRRSDLEIRILGVSVNHHHVPRDPRPMIRGKKQRHRGHILGLRKTAKRGALQIGAAHCVRCALFAAALRAMTAAIRGPSTQAGASTLARIPRWPASIATDFISPLIAYFDPT